MNQGKIVGEQLPTRQKNKLQVSTYMLSEDSAAGQDDDQAMTMSG